MYAVLRALLARFQHVSDAETRGTQLLHANLTPSQLQQLKRRAYFEVVGGTSGSRYRIHDRATINVDELDAGKKARAKMVLHARRQSSPAGTYCLPRRSRSSSSSMRLWELLGRIRRTAKSSQFALRSSAYAFSHMPSVMLSL